MLFSMILPVLGIAAENPIVTAEWLAKARLQGGVIVAEASWDPKSKGREYAAGHIPGAIHINTDIFETGAPKWRLRPLAELHAAIGRLGIGPETTVAVYSHQTIAAARVWWIMEYAGVKDVRYLDGGVEAWKRAGYPAETARNVLPPVRFQAPARYGVLSTAQYIRAHPEAVLVDVRSQKEYRGETSGYSYVKAKGRIPRALSAGDADDSARVYQNADGTLRGVEEIRRLWREAGVLNGREMIFYCGGGWRSSLAFLYARAMGLAPVRNYSDGWAGWSE